MRALLRIILPWAALILFLLPLQAGAEPLSHKLQQTYASVHSMRLEFKQELTHKESGATESRKGILFFKKKLQLRWEVTTPAPELLLIGEKIIWNVFPDEELAYKYAPSVANGSGGLIKVITGQASLAEDFVLEDEKKQGNLTSVRLYPKQLSQTFVEATLWVDSATHFIKKIKIYDFYGNENEIVFTHQAVNTTLKDDLFTYAPPKNFLIEDRTGETALQKPLLQ